MVMVINDKDKNLNVNARLAQVWGQMSIDKQKQTAQHPKPSESVGKVSDCNACGG